MVRSLSWCSLPSRAHATRYRKNVQLRSLAENSRLRSTRSISSEMSLRVFAESGVAPAVPGRAADLSTSHVPVVTLPLG